MRRILLFAISLVAVINVWAETYTATANGKTWTYEMDVLYSGVRVVSCTPETGELHIPDQLDGKDVVSIGSNAFFNKTGFTGTLTLPAKLKEIYDKAFYGCTGLTGELLLPNSLKAIGSYAFAGCTGFTGDLTIPNTVVYLREGAFLRCRGFTGRLTLSTSLYEIGYEAFAVCDGFTGDLTIPASVGAIKSYAFQHCEGFNGSLRILSQGVIGDGAFRSCFNFKELHLSNAISRIGLEAFAYCSGFTGGLTIPASVRYIDGMAFTNCNGFNGPLVIEEGVKTIGTNAFYQCSGFTGDLTIPNSVITIGDAAFAGCAGFTGTLTISTSLNAIGDNTFYTCSGFSGNLVIPNSVQRIGNSAFAYCSGFRGTLTLPSLLREIEYGAFNGCSGFTGLLELPGSINSIGDFAFNQCFGFMGELNIPDGVITIGRYAFQECSGFSGNLKLPNSLKTVGLWAFYNCSGLQGAVTIPNSVTTIDGWTFYNCNGITSLTFGENLQSLGSYAFGADEVTALQQAIFKPNAVLTSLDLNAFGRSHVKVNLYVIDASGLSALTSVTGEMPTCGLVYLPENVTNLDLSTANDAGGTKPANLVVGNTCETLVLNDNLAYGTNNAKGPFMNRTLLHPFTATKAYYKGKTLPAGANDAYSIYLPFEMTIPTGMEAYKLSSRDGSTLIFSKETAATMSAYTPYLIRRESGSTGALSFDNVAMTNQAVELAPELYTVTNGSTTDGWQFFGTTSPIENAEAEANRLYVLDANNIWKPVVSTATDGYVHSFRAFLQAPEGYTGAAPVAFILDEGTTTGLDRVQAEIEKNEADIYTLEGRYVGRNYDALPKGLYIVGGKKIYKL